MEFHIDLAGISLVLADAQDALFDVDPAAVVDLDASGQLRISAAVTAVDLIDVLQQAGYPLAPAQVVQLPSICCGGCGG
ncbi:MAG: hypothetical protein ABI178_13150 [Rhodanobacter sp.]